MKYFQQYERWISQKLDDPDLTAELEQIRGNKDEISDRFCIDLEFGTGGIRGIIGAGTNRMNIYTVRRAAHGIAKYLTSRFGNASAAIAYDSRIKSELFARETACVFAANGVRVHLYKELMPTPMLSFAVRELKCQAGVNITASHNPSEYNGLKAYGPDGCQLTTGAADEVMGIIMGTDIFAAKRADFDEALNSGTIKYIDEQITEKFFQHILNEQFNPGLCEKAELRVVYTPLNGAGNLPVREILRRTGASEVIVVPEQELPDGRFPTCPYPNPEMKEALSLGIELCYKVKPDLLLATDPDCDRVGIAVCKGSRYHLMSGNEIGVLLLDYIANNRLASGRMPENPIAVKSIVSTPMAEAVAKSYGVTMENVLTGFKWIGELIGELESKGEEKRYIFGFEESYGYLSGTYVRDKDAVNASMLICEMAAYYKLRGLSLLDAMDKLYKKFGYYGGTVISYSYEGAEGMEKMRLIMDNLRQNPIQSIAGFKVAAVSDYQKSERNDGHCVKAITLPKSNVLKYELDNLSTVIIRPSGTEPKIKAYVTAVGKDRTQSEELSKKLVEAFTKFMAI